MYRKQRNEIFKKKKNKEVASSRGFFKSAKEEYWSIMLNYMSRVYIDSYTSFQRPTKVIIILHYQIPRSVCGLNDSGPPQKWAMTYGPKSRE